jgi:hypothetical protein
MLISVRATPQRPGDPRRPHFSGVTSITSARSRIHSSSVIGLSEHVPAEHVLELLNVAPVRGLRFLSQKIWAVTSGGTCSLIGTFVITPSSEQNTLTESNV